MHMPWNETTSREYARSGRRYASDLIDREWALVAPFLPARKKIGRPRATELRDVYDAIATFGGLCRPTTAYWTWYGGVLKVVS
jgi:hypothetical protein